MRDPKLRARALATCGALLLLPLSLLPSSAQATSLAFSQDLFTIPLDQFGSSGAFVDVQLGNLDPIDASFDLSVSGTAVNVPSSDSYLSEFGIVFNEMGLAPHLTAVEVLSSSIALTAQVTPDDFLYLFLGQGQTTPLPASFTASFRIHAAPLAGSYYFYPAVGYYDAISGEGDGIQLSQESFDIVAVPEPATASLLLCGLGLLAAHSRR